MTFRLKSLFFELALGLTWIISAHAETIQVRAHEGLVAEALHPPEQQMSCRHLKQRTAATLENLGTFESARDSFDNPETRAELIEFVRKRNGHPASHLLGEKVYRLRYWVQNAVTNDAIEKSQSLAIFGNGLFEHADPQGELKQTRVVVTRGLGTSAMIELDVRAVDVCYDSLFEVAFLSGCPLETIRFEEWQSSSFVVEWWKCTDATVLSFDLTAQAALLGRRK